MENEMATSNSNNLVNPNAREAMNRFKMEAASEVGVNLKQGYNGDLTSRQAGSIGGQMVKKMIAAMTMPPVLRSMRLHSAGVKAFSAFGSHSPVWRR